MEAFAMTVRKLPTAAATLAALATAAPLLAVPPNDTRAAATLITIGNAYSGTTAGSTNAADTAGACGNSGSSGDVWYRLNAGATTGVFLSLCGSSFDTAMQAYNVGPGDTLGSMIACNDDSCDFQSGIAFNVVAGSSYWVRIAGYNGATGAYTMATAANDLYPGTPARSVGPDVTVGDLSDIDCYTPNSTGSVFTASSASAGMMTGMRSFAVGTNSWNIGDVPAEWQSSNQLHPAIAQQLYRAKNGRFEQVGISWLKHGFASTNQTEFPELGTCDTPPNGGTQLGVNCSDLYDSGLNGSRSYLGPRFDPNPTTGVFTYPWSSLVGTTPTDGADPVSRRIVTKDADVLPASNAGAAYFADCVYTTQDDAQWGNSRNNFSARKVDPATILSSPHFITGTYRRTTALELYASGDPAMNLSTVDMLEQTMNVTDKWRHWTAGQPDAALLPAAQWVTSTKQQNTRYLVGSKAIDNGNGTWDYEYAVMNLNSQRGGGSFALRLPVGGASNIDFHAPIFHSGDRFLNNPWLNNGGAAGKMSWTVDPATANVQVPTMSGTRVFGPNYVVYGTLFNYRFRAAAAPMTGTARLGFFRGPNATGYQGASMAVTNVKVPTVCTADMGSQGGVAGPDGALDNNDFITFIDAFFNNDLLMADVGQQGGLPGPDNTLDNNDFIVFIDAFFAGCGN
jgi:hypothetical protein